MELEAVVFEPHGGVFMRTEDHVSSLRREGKGKPPRHYDGRMRSPRSGINGEDPWLICLGMCCAVERLLLSRRLKPNTSATSPLLPVPTLPCNWMKSGTHIRLHL
ncbi:hypothetical protein BHE74_00059510 [Ensete ventricosum]|nr:hypothetical protein BHE74_00059510 [Ensete ventricosum]RZS03804.1 hypothetical protein BHM03_00034028 [Ensete ventricosum]